MKKSLVFCDLCGIQNENEMTSISKGKKNMDLCVVCFEKITLFYNVKNGSIEKVKDERIPKIGVVESIEEVVESVKI